jgi:hypothetical protein
MCGYWKGYVDPDFFPVEFYIWEIIPDTSIAHYSCHALSPQTSCFFFSTDQESASKTLQLTNISESGAAGNLFMFSDVDGHILQTEIVDLTVNISSLHFTWVNSVKPLVFNLTKQQGTFGTCRNFCDGTGYCDFNTQTCSSTPPSSIL